LTEPGLSYRLDQILGGRSRSLGDFSSRNMGVSLFVFAAAVIGVLAGAVADRMV
jgi:hypothetical protein